MACSLKSPTAGLADTDTPQVIRPRAIYVLLDVTPSYKKNRPAAVAKIREMLKALGPADRFYLIEIGGEFSPEQNVKIQCKMPASDPQILQRPPLPSLWRDYQSRLNEIWRRTSAIEGQIDSYLKAPMKDRDPTPLFEELRYASTRLAGEMDA